LAVRRAITAEDLRDQAFLLTETGCAYRTSRWVFFQAELEDFADNRAGRSLARGKGAGHNQEAEAETMLEIHRAIQILMETYPAIREES